MNLWGKHDASASPAFHPLVDHCLDVAVAFRHIASLPRVHSALQACTDAAIGPLHIERLAAVAYLHDVGKCNWGFQAKCAPGATATTGHVIEGAALLYLGELQSLFPPAWQALLQEMAEWFAERDVSLCAVLLAAISHHGRPVSDNDVGSRNANMRCCYPARAGIDLSDDDNNRAVVRLPRSRGDRPDELLMRMDIL